MFLKHLAACRWHATFDDYQGARDRGVRIDLGHNLVSENSLFGKQVHGVNIIEVNGASAVQFGEDRPEGDGLWTRQQGVTIAVRTADCLPIVLYAANGPLVMVLHAGWRGLTRGIIQRGIAISRLVGCAPSEMGAFLGPCISLAKFEVGPEVTDAICADDCGLTPIQVAFALSKSVNDRWRADLAVAAVGILINAGMDPASIDIIRQCTFEASNGWPSFRRDGAIRSHIWTEATLL